MEYITTNKIKDLEINEKNTYVITDFDKTLTSNKSKDSWDVSASLLGNEIKKEMSELYEIYHPIEINYKMPIKEKEGNIKKWYKECMNLYYKYGLTKEKLEQSTKVNNFIFRKGAKDFLQMCISKDIPIIILSAGIGNIIEHFLKQNDCYSNKIYIISNFIEFDDMGNMKKFDANKIIHNLNKKTNRHIPENYKSNLVNKKYKILLGDLVEDENMISSKEWDTTIKIAFLSENTKQNINTYKEHFDVILTENNATFDFIKLKVLKNS